MIITILSEPRAGSTNLLFWMGQHNECTVLLEPTTNSEYKKYSDKEVVIYDINDFSKWKYFTKHLVVKEICDPNKNYKSILQHSDKVIILFRENYIEQRQSWLMSINTKKWGGKYFFDESLLLDKDYNYLTEIKSEIQKYKTSHNFVISYEELYFRDGINKLINYIGIEKLNKDTFPFGEKYRKYKDII